MKLSARVMAILFAALVIATSCVRGSTSPMPQAAAGAQPAVSPLPPTPAPPAAASPIAAPPRVTVAMAGEPDAAALGAARLTAESCTESTRAIEERVKREIEQMRTAVDEELREWRALPACPPPGTVEAFGAGGLGLSGTGYGAGGYGDGIGLGAIGTIGHGGGIAARSASGTNNQVAGVDEADIVKNDGTYVYLAMNGALRIVQAMNPRVLSVVKLPGEARNVVVQGDRTVVFVSNGSDGGRAGARSRCTYGYDCTFAGDGTRTKILAFDVADRTRPRVVRTLELSGSLIAARRIGTTVHAVVADNDTPRPRYETTIDDLPYCRTNEWVVHARFDALKKRNEQRIRAAIPTYPTVKDHGVTRTLCDVMHTPLADGDAFTSVVSFDMTDDEAPAAAVTVQSRPGAVFASESGLYLSVTHRKARGQRWYDFYPSQSELSDIHKFRIGASPGDTRYVGSGVVPGHVLNQFAMDEWYGYLRVATTRGRVPDPAVESAVSVLAETDTGSLVRVGAIEHLAPSEDIRAVRFDGDRAYVVTFKKTDPLFVIDLHEPADPRVMGELKIPGFSTYLHRIDPTHLLSIGFDASDHGSFAFFDGIILQLFDVTSPTEPVLLHKEKIGSRGSSSEAVTNHLAFNFFPEKSLLAIPMTICEGGGDGRFGDLLSFSGLLIYDVSIEGGFIPLGGVDHGRHGVSCNTWWSHASSTVKRSIFMDDLVFSIATDRMKVQRMSHLGDDVADVALIP